MGISTNVKIIIVLSIVNVIAQAIIKICFFSSEFGLLEASFNFSFAVLSLVSN